MINTSILRGKSGTFAAMILSVLALVAPIAASAGEMKVTLLGTGSPAPSATRFSQSTLIEAGDQKLLFDMGRGVTIRLAELGIPFGSVTAHFITHMHSDHLVGFPDLWLTGWLATPYSSRKEPMVVFGPAGTVEMTEHLTEAFKADIQIRTKDERLPPEGIAFDAKDFGPGQIYSKGGVTVTAFEVHHGDFIKPAYGFKIEYDGKTVVISGDTTYDERIAEQAKGADLLIHEVASFDKALLEEFPRFKEIFAHHTDPEQAGKIFAAAAPRLAVYSHIIQRRGKNALPRDNDADEIVDLTRATYAGPLVAGEDLMSIVIDGGITVANKEGKEVLHLE